jgi:hypothetical protein
LSGDERLVARAPIHYRINDIFQDGRVLLSVSDIRAGILCQPAGETKERELGWLPYSWIEDLSADGRTLLFAAGRTGGLPPGSVPGVYLRNADGAPAVRLGDGHPLRLSPDGRWVLARRADSRRWFLLPTRAGMPRELPPGPIGELAAGDWLDDRRIVLWGREDLPGRRWIVYVQDVETGTLTPVTPEGVYPSEHGLVTPDRTRVLVKRDGNWLLYPVDGTEPRPIAPLDATDEPLQWSADGRALYVLHRGAPPKEAVAIVHRVDTVTGKRTPFKTLSPPDAAGVGQIERVAITPDGQSYCYTYSQMLASLYVAEGLR